jgi:hypothetical protein
LSEKPGEIPILEKGERDGNGKIEIKNEMKQNLPECNPRSEESMEIDSPQEKGIKN